MTIETRYNRRQSVWFMHNNKPTEKYVIGIIIVPIRDNTYPVIKYELSDHYSSDISDSTLLEKQLYITRADLVNSL